jgi:hypothetical protein
LCEKYKQEKINLKQTIMGKTNVVCVVKNIAILKRRPLCVQNKLCKSKETTRT